MTHWRRWIAGLMLGLGLLLGGPLAMLAGPQVALEGNWATSDRSSAGLAPNPAATREAVVQVYAARAFGWRGAFGTHTWLAVKPTGAQRYRVLQVDLQYTVALRAGRLDRQPGMRAEGPAPAEGSRGVDLDYRLPRRGGVRCEPRRGAIASCPVALERDLRSGQHRQRATEQQPQTEHQSRYPATPMRHIVSPPRRVAMYRPSHPQRS